MTNLAVVVFENGMPSPSLDLCKEFRMALPAESVRLNRQEPAVGRLVCLVAVFAVSVRAGRMQQGWLQVFKVVGMTLQADIFYGYRKTASERRPVRIMADGTTGITIGGVDKARKLTRGLMAL